MSVVFGKSKRDVIVDAIRERLPLRGAGLATILGGGLGEQHQLPRDVADQYAALVVAGRIAYTVYSYSTPIGWATADGGVYVPDIYYSTTTSKHQALAREGFGLPEPVRKRGTGRTGS